MKNFSLFASLLLILNTNCWNLFAQPELYQKSGTIEKDGYNYRIDNSNGLVNLYNAQNSFTYKTRTKKDGTPADSNIQLGLTPTFIHDRFHEEAVRVISGTYIKPYVPVFNIENPEELKGLIISLIINSSTGKVQEVGFIFTENGLYSQVPIEAYRQIETEIIRLMQFELTEAGKQLSHCRYSWTSDLFAPCYWIYN